MSGEEIKAMCPLGIAKKIIRLMPQLQESLVCHNEASIGLIIFNLIDQVPSSTTVKAVTPTQSVQSFNCIVKEVSSVTPTESMYDHSDSSSSIAMGTSASVISGGSSNATCADIPKLWKPSITSCINKKELTDGVRGEIVRTLVDILFQKSQKPTHDDCVDLARKLILAYPWMKDNATGFGPL